MCYRFVSSNHPLGPHEREGNENRWANENKDAETSHEESH